MTDRELMQQAIEAMEYADACLKKQLTTKAKHEYAQDLLMEAGTALRERLAQPETVMAEYKFQTYAAYKTDGEMKIGVVPEQEPVAWAGLTDRDIEEIARYQDEHGSGPWHRAFARAIEAKLREKNA